MRRRLAIALAATLFAVAGWATPAFGHAVLQSTDPPSGSVLPRSPGTVVLHFGEDVEIQFGAIRVFNSDGKRVDTGNAFHPKGDGHAVAIAVPASLGNSGYVVTWRVVSADAHPVHGAFTFQIGTGGSASAQSTKVEAAKLLASSGRNPEVGMTFGIIRFLAFASLFVLVGGAAFVAGAWPEGAADRRVRRLLWAGWGGAVATTALAVAIQGPYGGGLSVARMFSPSVISAVVHTRFGQVYVARLILLVLAAGPILRLLLRPQPRPRWLVPVAVTTGAAILVTPGLAGHAASGSLIALAIPFDLVHVAAAAVWLGGLAVLAVAVLAGSPGGDKTPTGKIVRRFSQWALGAVVAIAITGGFAAWRQVGSLSAVSTTTFGRLVLAKTIIFCVLVGVASTSRRLVHRNLALPFGLSRTIAAPGTEAGVRSSAGTGNGARIPAAAATAAAATATGNVARAPANRAADARTKAAVATKPSSTRFREARRRTIAAPSQRRPAPRRLGPGTDRRSRLRRSVLLELVLAAAILGVTALLVNAQPARQVAALPFSAEVHAGPDVLVDVVVDPAKSGPVAVHLYTLSADGAQLDVVNVTATLSLPSAGVANLVVPLQRAGPGHFSVYGFTVPLRGSWKLDMTVRTGQFSEVYADPITVRMR